MDTGTEEGWAWDVLGTPSIMLEEISRSNPDNWRFLLWLFVYPETQTTLSANQNMNNTDNMLCVLYYVLCVVFTHHPLLLCGAAIRNTQWSITKMKTTGTMRKMLKIYKSAANYTSLCPPACSCCHLLWFYWCSPNIFLITILKCKYKMSQNISLSPLIATFAMT